MWSPCGVLIVHVDSKRIYGWVWDTHLSLHPILLLVIYLHLHLNLDHSAAKTVNSGWSFSFFSRYQQWVPDSPWQEGFVKEDRELTCKVVARVLPIRSWDSVPKMAMLCCFTRSTLLAFHFIYRYVVARRLWERILLIHWGELIWYWIRQGWSCFPGVKIKIELLDSMHYLIK